jgi:hypothetical protein
MLAILEYCLKLPLSQVYFPVNPYDKKSCNLFFYNGKEIIMDSRNKDERYWKDRPMLLAGSP